MKHFIQLIAVLTAPALMIACADKQGTVNGTLENAEGKTIVLSKFLNNAAIPVDSALIGKNGSFTLSAASLPLDFYQLGFQDPNQGAIIILTDSTQKVSLTADLSNLAGSVKVQEGDDTRLLYEFYGMGGQIGPKIDSLRQLASTRAREGDNEGVVEAQLAQEEVLDEYRAFVRNFVDANASSPAVMAALNDLDPRVEMDRFVEVRNALAPRFGNSTYFKMLDNQIEEMKRKAESERFIQPGAAAPDITLNDPNGNLASLSSLKGKVVLIDFWASWCGPCRRENPNVVRVYNKYRNAGFEIFGVSLDQSKEKWVKAIEDDKLTWPQVSDLKGWQSAGARLYNVSSIPHTILLDQEGVIIASNLRGAALENKLAEIFGF